MFDDLCGYTYIQYLLSANGWFPNPQPPLKPRAHQIYYMFWFLFIVFLILVITCAETTILLCYFHLCSEDYHWWWRAYLSSGSTALYFFLYSIYFYAGLYIFLEEFLQSSSSQICE